MTNRKVGAEEALSLGFVARLAGPEELQKTAMEIALNLAAGPTTSLGLTKHLLNSAYEDIGSYLAAEAFAQAVAFGSPEFDEGIRAFQEKRRPDFAAARRP